MIQIELYELERIARELGITRECVRLHMKKGHLKTFKVANAYVATSPDAQAFMSDYKAGKYARVWE